MSIEKLLEPRLRNEVKKMGGIALKFTSHITTGMPDRMVLLPGGRIYFVELKSTKKKPTPLQALQIRTLRMMGFVSEVIDDREGLDLFLSKLQEDNQ